MCGRFTINNFDDIENKYQVDIPPTTRPSYNIAPQMPLPLILKEDKYSVLVARWGLIPSWANDTKIAFKLINIRSESIKEKPSFRRLFDKNRCLVVSHGFYEWKKTDDGQKIPYYFHRKDNKLFAFTGIWDTWEDAEGKPLHTFSILTCPPNKEVADIHNRMPVILKHGDENIYLDDSDKAIELLRPYPEGEFEVYRVSEIVNSPKNDKIDNIRKVE